MKKVFYKIIVTLISILIIIVLSVFCTYFVYEPMVVDKCLDSGGEYISDLTMCLYSDGESSTITLHWYTLMYIFAAFISAFTILVILLKYALSQINRAIDSTLG